MSDPVTPLRDRLTYQNGCWNCKHCYDRPMGHDDGCYEWYCIADGEPMPPYVRWEYEDEERPPGLQRRRDWENAHQIYERRQAPGCPLWAKGD